MFSSFIAWAKKNFLITVISIDNQHDRPLFF